MIATGISHEHLVQVAARWLNTIGCHAVLSELSADIEIPDAIGWKYGNCSILIECKVSRSDFLADKQKKFRVHPEKGMGQRRYYLAPKGMLTVGDVQGIDKLLGGAETGWGLLETIGKNVAISHPSQVFIARNVRAEMRMLVHALNKIQMRIDSPLYKAVKFNSLAIVDPLKLYAEDLAYPPPELMYI